GALEQWRADLVLQGGDESADAGLRHVQALGGPPEVQFFAQREKRLDMCEFHGHSRFMRCGYRLLQILPLIEFRWWSRLHMVMGRASYRLLGRSGLRVSPLALGTMTFGSDWGWGADWAEARAIFDAYVERGGNFVDTANGYTDGTAERMVGEFAQG